MHYYLVAIATAKYHGKELLTYASEQPLKLGMLVNAPLQRTKAFGFIAEETTKPSFTTKELEPLDPSLLPLPQPSLELFTWLRNYYPAPLGASAQLFLPGNFPKK